MRNQGEFFYKNKSKALTCSLILLLLSYAIINAPQLLSEEPYIILPKDKIDAELLSQIDSNDTHANDIILSYNEEVSEFKVKCALTAADDAVEIAEVFDELNMMNVKTSSSAIFQLAKHEFIERIWSNNPREVSKYSAASKATVSDEDYESPVDMIGARDLWEQGYNGSGIVIAVLDTGVDIMNPDLTVNAFASFVEGDSLPLDLDGHGTYAASIAAGSGNRSNGLYSGIAPGATILGGKVLLAGFAVPSWIVSGIEWAASHGADIILLPFNTFGAPGDAVDKAIQAVTEKGILVIAAAGDDGPDYLTIMSPGGSKAALTVGAYDTINEKIPDFSGRGPTFEMYAKPDVIAPGVGIIGAKNGGPGGTLSIGGFDFGGLLGGSLDFGALTGDMDLGGMGGIDVGGLGGLIGGGAFGEDVNENYTRADSTAASAAIAAGAAAILMQAFDRATPIVLSNTLRDTAATLPFGANDAGAGLLDLDLAFDYLSEKQYPIETHSRSPSLPLLSFGFLNADGNDASTTLMMSSYGTVLLAIDSRPGSEMGTHLLMGTLSLRWNNMTPTNLMMFDVKRELHQVSASSEPDYYNRYIGILSYDDIFVTLCVESYNLTSYSELPLTAFRITPYILNLGSNPISNVSLFLSYSLDLFLDGIEDHGKYNLRNQQLFAYGQAENYDRFYMGVNSSRPTDAFEVGNSSTISNHVSNDNLTGSTKFDGDVGLAMKWDYGIINPNDIVNVTIALGFGENRTILDESIKTMWKKDPGVTYVSQGDVIVVEADIPRNALQGETYQSQAIIMNIGEEPANVTAGLLVSKSLEDQEKLFLNLFQVGELNPFEAIKLTAEWRPEEKGIHTAIWIGTYAFEDILGLLLQLTSDIMTSIYQLLDDFLIRDVFVITPIESTSVFPKILPAAPFFMDFPADYGMFTFSLSTTESLGNLTITKHGNASDWGNFTLTPAENVNGFYNFSLFLLVPPITVDGYHKCDYVIHTDLGWTTNITLEKKVKYPRAMMLLDTSHGGGLGAIAGGFGDLGGGGLGIDTGNTSFLPAQDSDDLSALGMDLGDLGSINDLLSSFRMTTLSGLSEMKRIMAEKNLDLVETPGISLTEELLEQFSTLFIFTPSIEYNSTDLELLDSFTENGGNLVIFGDSEDRMNLTIMNQLLSHYGYVMSGEHSAENTTEIIPDSALGAGLESIWLGGGTYILSKQSLAQVTLNGNPVVLLDSSQSEIALFGSSRIFMNQNLVKCNNTGLLQNLNKILLQNTLTAFASLSENTTKYPIGKSVYINLYVFDYTGEPVGDLTVLIIYQLPNGSIAFFIAGYVENGLYGTQFTPNYWKNDGIIHGIFIILGEGYASTYASITFELYVPPTSPTSTSPFSFLTMFQVALISSVGIFSALILGLVFYNKRRKKKYRIPELDSQLTMEIDNTLNTLLAAFMQIEELIRREDLDRVEKVELLRVLMESLEQARKMFNDISDKVGGV
jgi:subtilisin family serine protease